MCGSRGRSNKENCDSLNGLFGKFSNLIISRRDRCEERHPGHPRGSRCGGVELEGAGDGSRGCMVHTTCST